MNQDFPLSRRHFMMATAAILALPRTGTAATYREITWDDLIPPGVPYAEIIAEGSFDEENDIWKPVFDENAVKLNTELDGADVLLPGYVIPIDIGAEGVSSFILVPYVGACLHVPPPPPNQLVFVETETPWPAANLWDAVWVSGKLTARPKSTDIAEIGYHITAQDLKLFE